MRLVTDQQEEQDQILQHLLQERMKQVVSEMEAFMTVQMMNPHMRGATPMQLTNAFFIRRIAELEICFERIERATESL